MIQIEQSLKDNYISVLRKNGFPEKHRKEHGYYLKWLRYYLDFCHKYNFDRSDLNSLLRFIEKLCSKRQNENQLQQATDAVRYFYSLIKSEIKPDDFSENSTPEIKEHILSYPKKEKVKTEPNEKINDHVFNQSWQEVYQSLENEIKVRHYSPKTHKSYKGWVRKFQTFTRSKDLNLNMQAKNLSGNGFFLPNH